MDDDSFLIKVLKFATTKDSFVFEDLCSEVNPTDIQRKNLALQIENGHIFGHEYINYPRFLSENKAPRVELFATAEDHFRLLEYEALKEARGSSLSATRFATAALVVSVLSIIISLVFDVLGATNGL